MKSVLQLTNISVKFGGLEALSNVSFEVFEGEILGLIGPNGAGKTTLFNVLSGLERPSSGQVLYRGNILLNEQKVHKIAGFGIARTFQIVHPFENMTVLENVAMGAMFVRKFPLKKALDHAHDLLTEMDMNNLENLGTEVLTIAQRKKMEVIRALATGPNILLLDEVLAGLNLNEINKMVDYLKDVKAKFPLLTILTIEHIMKAIMSVSDRIIVLNRGKVLAIGKPDEISKNDEVVRVYLGDNQ